MSSNEKTEIIYFPFSPGIPWKVNNKFIINEVPSFVWPRFIQSKKNVIVAHGGLLETFFSLSLAEAFNIFYPQKQIYWCGEEKYKNILAINGLVKYNDLQIAKESAEAYITPIFLDKNKVAYFNCLNNYISKRTFDLKKTVNNKDPVLKQIFSNSLTAWDVRYIPKIRKDIADSFNKWCANNKFYKNNPYVVIIPEKTGHSQHDSKCLKWNDNKVKALSAILYQRGINTVVVSNNVSKYKTTTNFIMPVDLQLIFNIIPSARLVMSEDIDYLLISMIISDAMIISRKLKYRFSLDKNKIFLGVENVTFMNNKLNPADISTIIKAKL